MITTRLQMPVVLAFVFAAVDLSVAAISINISKPVAGAPAFESLEVRAGVSSPVEVASVTAAVGDRQTNLVFSASGNVWTNVISIVGMPYGPATLTVTAQDVLGGTAQTQRVFAVDYPPTLTVVAPLHGTVGRPQIYVEASATDDGLGGTSINVYNPMGVLLIRGTNNVQGLVSLNAASNPVIFEAVDSSGQKQYITRQVFLELSSELTEVAVAPGPILDVTSDRFLYTVSPDVPTSAGSEAYGKPEARILHRGTGRIDEFNFPSVLLLGALASTGAALLAYGPPNFELYRWSETNSVDYYGAGVNVKVVGNTAGFINVGTSGGFVLRDIVRTNQQAVISLSDIKGFDLGPNLDLIFSHGWELVYRNRPASTNEPYLNRTTTLLKTNGGYYPITDGTRVIYSRNMSNNFAVAIKMLTPPDEETLSIWPTPHGAHVQYQINNGWVAFTKPGSTGQSQVWTRSPSGALQQRSFFTSSSLLESLGPRGEISFINQSVIPPGRYLALAGSLPRWISYAQGTVRWTNGRLFLLLGRSLFEVGTARLSCAKSAGGDIALTFNGPVGAPYTLQASSNLKEWFELLMFTNNAGTVTWTNQPAGSQRFYRTVVAPN